MGLTARLDDYQLDAIRRMKNGCILCGGVGSGKSRTSLGYYFTQNGGRYYDDDIGFTDMSNPKDLYIITTARKRDTKEWDLELVPFLLSQNPEFNHYKNTVVIDSWNNIGKYKNVKGAFFIFDEQRVVGKGAWVKSFLRIARFNEWILLSATPGDKWEDYVPVFLANGFYSCRTEFNEEHVVFSRFTKYPKVEKYINTGRLIKYRNDILVTMDFQRQTESIHKDIVVPYDIDKYKILWKYRWNEEKEQPVANASELCFLLRKCCNADERRFDAMWDIIQQHKKVIIFYNFDYELEGLRHYLTEENFTFAEWNGHLHQDIPDGDEWAYLVHYTSGAEGWNCITCNTIIFFSQSYSWRTMEQASGRINRRNTKFHYLYYYHLKSKSGIDIAIDRALKEKKKFNEGGFING